MRILVLTSADRALDNRSLWLSLQAHGSVDIHFLDKSQQRKLRQYFAKIDCSTYDRIVLDLMFKCIYTQGRFLRTLPSLTIYEEDAYLDLMPGSRWLGAFMRFYRRLPGARIISTGYRVTRHLQASGVDAHFVPKGFDPDRLRELIEVCRDIELGFIGRLGSSAYAARRNLLEGLAELEPLEMMRTSSADEYLEALNRIRFFVSADVGLGEYMAKNFEAMACGCLLFAKRQGQGEEHAIGFEDGINVLLYDDLDSLRARIAWARENCQLAETIAYRGREHVLASNAYPKLAERVSTIISEPFIVFPSAPWWRFL